MKRLMVATVCVAARIAAYVAVGNARVEHTRPMDSRPVVYGADQFKPISARDHERDTELSDGAAEVLVFGVLMGIILASAAASH
jgi:hypothetical protein